MKIHCLTVVLMLVVMAPFGRSQQRPPWVVRDLPDPGPNRINVRFALGAKAAECERFHLTAVEGGKLVLDGWFASGFDIPKKAEHLPRVDQLDLRFTCAEQSWHFANVGERAFLHGWWWVGTDFPPFQDAFQSDQFKDAAWIRYLIVDPSASSGFNVYHFCPKEQEQQKSGPCAPD
jgi:hypothetical protein